MWDLPFLKPVASFASAVGLTIIVGPFHFRMLSFCDSRFQLAVSEAFSTQHTKVAEKHRVRTGMEWVPAALSHIE